MLTHCSPGCRSWFDRYWRRVASDGRPEEQRHEEMQNANPRYILRNWAAYEVYEAAERGDYTLLNELHQVLSQPYVEQGEDVDSRWALPTPNWARGVAGITFMT